MKLSLALLSLAGMALTGQVLAVLTVVECRDPAGNSFYSETCPPGTAKVTEKKLPGTAKVISDEPAPVPKAPVTLYSAQKCDACDLVRLSLQKRAVDFIEKDVSNNAESQGELQKATGGVLSVPTVTVGETVLIGYNQTALEAALTQGGYPLPAGDDTPPAAGTAPAAPSAEGGDSETTPAEDASGEPATGSEFAAEETAASQASEPLAEPAAESSSD